MPPKQSASDIVWMPSWRLHVHLVGLANGSHEIESQRLPPSHHQSGKKAQRHQFLVSIARRLTLVNSTFSTMPIFSMCTLKILVTIINAIDRIRRDYLWCGSDENAHRNPQVAWDKVCRPKNKGGLGVLNLKIHNTTLLFKFIHKFYDREYIPWVNLIWANHYSGGKIPHAYPKTGSFWWKDVFRLVDYFRGDAML
jgi:hypothetical protein